MIRHALKRAKVIYISTCIRSNNRNQYVEFIHRGGCAELHKSKCKANIMGVPRGFFLDLFYFILYIIMILWISQDIHGHYLQMTF